MPPSFVTSLEMVFESVSLKVILNPSVILGPGDWTKGSSQIFQKIYDGLKYYTSGSTGYVDVTDVAEWSIKLLESDIKNESFTYKKYYYLYPLFLAFISLMLYIYLRNKRGHHS